MRNLVDNAARHAEEKMAVSVRENANCVELIVEDDGPGIPEAQRQRVFERFVRLDEARARDAGGSGLGLAIVKEIVAAHGGTVAVSTSWTGRCPVRRTARRGARFREHASLTANLNGRSDAFRLASATSTQAVSITSPKVNMIRKVTQT